MPYIITQNTLALLPTTKGTKILEISKILTSSENIGKIISENCKFYGSSLEGRKAGSSYIIGSTYKPPIILNEKNHIILVPTHSSRSKECSWISLNNILNYRSYNDKKVHVVFKNNQNLILNISYLIFDRQVLKATRLESALNGRNNKKIL